MRGYVDSTGQLFATRARIRRNDVRPTEIRLQGPVHNILAPNFAILGITVRTGVGTTFRVLLPLTPATENAPLNLEIR